jgi:hypothetical protein
MKELKANLSDGKNELTAYVDIGYTDRGTQYLGEYDLLDSITGEKIENTPKIRNLVLKALRDDGHDLHLNREMAEKAEKKM